MNIQRIKRSKGERMKTKEEKKKKTVSAGAQSEKKEESKNHKAGTSVKAKVTKIKKK